MSAELTLEEALAMARALDAGVPWPPAPPAPPAPLTRGATAAEWDHFARVLSLTVDLLPVVQNPSAIPSPASTIKSPGKVPSHYNAAGHVAGFKGWTKYTATAADIDGWSRCVDYGICLQTRTVRGIDVDISDAGLSLEIEAVITERFGCMPLPRRSRPNSPRFLAAFTMPGSYAKRIINTRAGRIEFLGNGQQFVACGTHPSGARYEWRGGLPAFSAHSPAALESLWAELERRFGTSNGSKATVLSATPDWVANARKAQHALSDTWFEPLTPELKEAEVRAVVATWTPGQATERESWFTCVRSLADAVDRGLDHETALDIAEEFSEQTTADNLADRETIAAKMAEHGNKPSIYAAAAVAQRFGYTTPPNRIPRPPPASILVPTAVAEPTAVPVGAAAVLDLRITRNGVIADEENVLRILMRDPNLKGIVRYDEFAGDMLLARPITDDPTLVAERATPRQWTDADTVTLQTYIQRRIMPRVARDKIEAVVAKYARHDCAFHPVREYLQSLAWDGAPRLSTWLLGYLGADGQPEAYLAAIGRAWMIAAVARIMAPGCQVDSALVLEGAQGIRKSTALRLLAGDEYFSDSLPADLAHKDARDHLRGKWIVELAELAQFRRAEIETVKAFISRRYEQYRPSYGRHEIKFPRQCVFAGSTNDDTYLVDTTGNRRFWVVACTRVDLEALTRDRDQLWAEAVVLYRAGEPWHLTGTLEDMAAREARARVAHDPWTAKVADIVATGTLRPDVSPGEVMTCMALHESERHQRNAARVGQILRDLHWNKGRRDRTRGQLYTRPPGMPVFSQAPWPPGVAPAPPCVPPPLSAPPARTAPPYPWCKQCEVCTASGTCQATPNCGE